MKVTDADSQIIRTTRHLFIPITRIAIFLIFFWFGALKLLGESPASPLAEALVDQTIGLRYFEFSYKLLAILECVIGLLFLIPKATRIVIPLLLVHLLVVSGPLILLADQTWQHFLVPTLEGQYIIKNVAIVALAIGIAAHTEPLSKK